jgi:hypothetical protein
MVKKLKADYDAWFTDVTSARDYTTPSRIFIGAPQENPVLLTRQDWRGNSASWEPKSIGHWYVNVVTDAKYQVKLLFDAPKSETQAKFSCGDVSVTMPVRTNQEECMFQGVHLPVGNAIVEAQLGNEAKPMGVKYLEIRRLE